jgi:hypothetical protein
MLDLSKEGIRLETDSPFERNFLLKVQLALKVIPEMELYGKIVWIKGKQVGIRLILPTQELSKFLENLED